MSFGSIHLEYSCVYIMSTLCICVVLSEVLTYRMILNVNVLLSSNYTMNYLSIMSEQFMFIIDE